MNRTLIERLREMAKKENVVLEIVIDGRDNAVIPFKLYVRYGDKQICIPFDSYDEAAQMVYDGSIEEDSYIVEVFENHIKCLKEDNLYKDTKFKLGDTVKVLLQSGRWANRVGYVMETSDRNAYRVAFSDGYAFFREDQLIAVEEEENEISSVETET